MKSLTLAALAAAALLASAAPSFAGDMKDQGPINANPPAYGASLSTALLTAAYGPVLGADAGPIDNKPAHTAQGVAAPTTSQLADSLRGRIYEAPAQ